MSGFTLIELLVVISIIGLLSSVVLASLSTARIRARDAKRMSDIHQIQLALTLYYDTNNSYPSSGKTSWVSSADPEWASAFGAALQPYLNPMPVDPINNSASPWYTTGNYSYAYVQQSSVNNSSPPFDKYTLLFQLENTSSPLRCGLKNYQLHYSPSNGGEQPMCTAFVGGTMSNYLFGDH